MAQPPEERRPPPLVADRDASLDPPPPRHAAPVSATPRPWGLRLAVLGLALGLAGVSFLAWEERQLLHAEIARLEGQFSNVHARFDGLAPGEALTRLDEAQRAQASRLETLAASLDDQRQRLEALHQGQEGPRPQVLAEALSRLEAQQATLQEWLSASRDSLAALETLGEEARAELSQRLDGLVARSTTAREALDERLTARVAEEDARGVALEERLATLEGRLDEEAASRRLAVEGLRETLEPLASRLDNAQEARGELRDRLASLHAEVQVLRRSQLAIEARLELLAP
ncbi:hypothetical protein [Bisbaumannia pacifica]|uniref:Uncharacterized protein n=1 Tax=Bisbaumannia pacifica TaxID=77098 RepID=A0ABD4KWR2_9GAMM|nr:hypothetical protein [Halomonas pacifica]MBH8578875.1 hypothetical protein [Halomonas pacifica]